MASGVNTARFLKYVWSFYNIMHERVTGSKTKVLSQLELSIIDLDFFEHQFRKEFLLITMRMLKVTRYFNDLRYAPLPNVTSRNKIERYFKWILNDRPREKCPSELLWSVFSHTQAEYRDLQCKYPYSARMRENTDWKNSEYEKFLRSVL